jgi:Ca2+-binding RTX toxin-like protein
MFNSIATQNAYIKEYLDVTGDAHFNADTSIEKNLEVKGTTYTKNISTDGNITLTGELTADGNITGDKINCTEICINDNMTIHGSSIMLNHSDNDILNSNSTPELTMNCEVVFWGSNDILVGSKEERLPWMSYGTGDLTPGVDNLPEGHIYLVYEPA